MTRQTLTRLLGIMTLLGAATPFTPATVHAQQFDFSQIGAFESMGSGVARGGSSPKTIVEGTEGHVVLLTIWNSDTDAKLYWKALDGGAPQTTVVHGTTVRAFQTAGGFKLQALGNDTQRVKYDYVVLRLNK